MIQPVSYPTIPNDHNAYDATVSENSSRPSFSVGSSQVHNAERDNASHNNPRQRSNIEISTGKHERPVQHPDIITRMMGPRESTVKAMENYYIGTPVLSPSQPRSTVYATNHPLYSVAPTVSGHQETHQTYRPEVYTTPQETAYPRSLETVDPHQFSHYTNIPTEQFPRYSATYQAVNPTSQHGPAFSYPLHLRSPQTVSPIKDGAMNGPSTFQRHQSSIKNGSVSHPTCETYQLSSSNSMKQKTPQDNLEGVNASLHYTSLPHSVGDTSWPVYSRNGGYHKQCQYGKNDKLTGEMSATEYLQRYASQLTGPNYNQTPSLVSPEAHASPTVFPCPKSTQLKKNFEKRTLLGLLQVFWTRLNLCCAFSHGNQPI